jgi:hypothetical protein
MLNDGECEFGNFYYVVNIRQMSYPLSYRLCAYAFRWKWTKTTRKLIQTPVAHDVARCPRASLAGEEGKANAVLDVMEIIRHSFLLAPITFIARLPAT